MSTPREPQRDGRLVGQGGGASGAPSLVLSRERIDGVVFDLDGVLTDTARIHAGAWKETFDAFLRARADRLGAPFVPFDAEGEYLAHVDGRRRRDGIRAFLESRGIVLPEGDPRDPADAETVEALARVKDKRVQEHLREAEPLPGAEALMAALRDAGLRVVVASSSANCQGVLEATGLARLVDIRVDGVDAKELELPGKPDPSMFQEALRRAGLSPDRAVVFEDAISGVEAGRRAGMALVVGVGRGRQADALKEKGADAVVADLSEVGLS